MAPTLSFTRPSGQEQREQANNVAERLAAAGATVTGQYPNGYILFTSETPTRLNRLIEQLEREGWTFGDQQHLGWVSLPIMFR